METAHCLFSKIILCFWQIWEARTEPRADYKRSGEITRPRIPNDREIANAPGTSSTNIGCSSTPSNRKIARPLWALCMASMDGQDCSSRGLIPRPTSAEKITRTRPTFAKKACFVKKKRCFSRRSNASTNQSLSGARHPPTNLTTPHDKTRPGRAQALGRWLKTCFQKKSSRLSKAFLIPIWKKVILPVKKKISC